MDKNKKIAIYNAVEALTGLDGTWEDQKGAIRMTGSFFSLKLLTPGSTWERSGNLISEEDEKQKILTRFTSTLQVKIFNSEEASDIMNRAHNNSKFHSLLNAGEVVCWGHLTSGDISSVYVEYENTYFVDFQIAWSEEDDVQPDVDVDDVIEKAEIEGKIDDIYQDIYVDAS